MSFLHRGDEGWCFALVAGCPKNAQCAPGPGCHTYNGRVEATDCFARGIFLTLGGAGFGLWERNTADCGGTSLEVPVRAHPHPC